MGDATGVLVAEIVDPGPLALAERTKRRRRELRRERQRLQAGQDAVAAKHGHEPGQARGGQGVPRRGEGGEAEGGEIHQAAVVRIGQRLPVALQAGGVAEPGVEVTRHVGSRLPCPRPVLLPVVPLPSGAERRDDLQVRDPLAVGLDSDRERQALVVDPGGGRRRDPGLTHEPVALVAEHQAAVLHAIAARALLGEGVLHLEQIGEVAVGVDAHLDFDRLVPGGSRW